MCFIPDTGILHYYVNDFDIYTGYQPIEIEKNFVNSDLITIFGFKLDKYRGNTFQNIISQL